MESKFGEVNVEVKLVEEIKAWAVKKASISRDWATTRT